MNIPSNITTLIAGIVLTLVSLWVGQNHGLLPVAASEEAGRVDGLFNTMMTIATGLFLIVQGVLIYSAIRFRKRPGDDTDGPPIRGNIPLEIVWTAIPATIILVIGVYSFDVYNSMGGLDPMASHDHRAQEMAHQPGSAIAAPLPGTEAAKPVQSKQVALGVGASPGTQGQVADLTVNVMGLQFAWIFTYPDSGVTTSELHIPVGKEVQLNITAQDVLHAFWLPQFRLKQDAIPGRPSELRFRAQKVGEYPIVCAELCGSYHGAMKSQIFVESPEDFDAWLQSQIAANSDNLQQAVAYGSERSEADYLAARAPELGIDANTLGQVRPPAAGHHAI